MEDHLQSIDPRLMWEFGPAVSGDGHRLVITPESNRQLRPLVDSVLNRAPKLAAWEFYGHRLPESMELAEQAVKGRTGGSLDGVTVRASIGKGNRVDLVFQTPRYAAAGRDAAHHDVFAATESLLGEKVLDDWVGVIEVEPAKRGLLAKFAGRRTSPGIGIDRFAETVTALVESIREQLPDRPLFQIDMKADGHKWANFKLEPKEDEDYAGRGDLLVMISGYSEMISAAHGSGSFVSSRFSRFGEQFCYLKIDGREGSGKFGGRDEIEDAIDSLLIPAKAGCVVGGGTGLVYSYIDLALADVSRAIPLIQQVLRGGEVSSRSWVLFFEADLQDEWVGIWDDTPEPPGINAD
ncbi:MAG: hypothetical protein ABSH20_02765 [Tepidisphaeraceae bacterium]